MAEQITLEKFLASEHIAAAGGFVGWIATLSGALSMPMVYGCIAEPLCPASETDLKITCSWVVQPHSQLRATGPLVLEEKVLLVPRDSVGYKLQNGSWLFTKVNGRNMTVFQILPLVNIEPRTWARIISALEAASLVYE